MRARLGVMSAVVLSAALAGSSCGDSTPSPAAPSASPAPAATPAPPAVTARPGIPVQLVGVWNLGLRLTEVTGAGCVADTLRAQMEEAATYSLSITDTGLVTIASPSDGLSCRFTAEADGDDGFKVYGFYSCAGEPRIFRCADGTQYRFISFGQDITGRLAGSQIGGTWTVDWYEIPDDRSYVFVKAQFTGTR